MDGEAGSIKHAHTQSQKSPKSLFFYSVYWLLSPVFCLFDQTRRYRRKFVKNRSIFVIFWYLFAVFWYVFVTLCDFFAIFKAFLMVSEVEPLSFFADPLVVSLSNHCVSCPPSCGGLIDENPEPNVVQAAKFYGQHTA